jgi:membrane protease YdiL (CAAX protease family)
LSSPPTYLPYLTSLLIHPAVIHGPLQPAAVLIQAGRLREAHRLLLLLTRSQSHNPHLWLLLAWSSPSHTAALDQYATCLQLDPSNELAKAGLSATLAAIRNNGHRSKLSSSGPAAVDLAIAPSPHGTPFSEAPSQRLPHAPLLGQALPLGFARLSDVHFFWLMLLYLLLLACAELVTTYSTPQFGLGLHGLLLVVLFLHASVARVRAQRRFLFSIALAPLIRLLSLSMPLVDFQFSYWYAIIGFPLLLAAYLVFRFTGYKPADVGLNSRKLPLQFHLAMLGFALGWIEYQILKPAPLTQSLNFQDILIPALILLIFTGFLEEFIFRGLMQRAADNIMGDYGPYWISLLFAVMHIGYRSLADFGFVLLVGLIFAYIVKRTGSIWGVTLAHGFTNITLYLLIPLLIH